AGAPLRRPGALAWLPPRLPGLSPSLGEQPFLAGDRFPAGDLLMSTVLRILPDETAKHANLAAYVARCTARPAFSRALSAQLGDFRQAA
ncbi:MAG: glutathione S-transferase family protein, partial [Hyphomonadaceae bacterium]